jgi:hypothetical protein
LIILLVEITNDLNVFVSHEYKGVYKLELDSKLLKALKPFVKYKTPIKGKNTSLTKFNNSIYYANERGYFKI